MEYTYENITVSPCLILIQSEILASAMTDKSVEGCGWDEDTQILRVLFTSTLSGSDEDILDDIITNRIPASSPDCCSPKTPSDEYVDRGDSSEYDFNVEDFTTDLQWHDLDLSSIVPEKAKLVHMRIRLSTPSLAGINFRKKGNTNAVNTSTMKTQVANVYYYEEFFVPCDVNRMIQYMANNVSWTVLDVTVRGWFI